MSEIPPTPLDKLKKAMEHREWAKENYKTQVKYCLASKISYAAMARATGQTEASIRMYVNRNGLKEQTPEE